MKAIKQGGHPVFEADQETAAYVSAMLRELRAGGMDAVRRYSRQFDEWDPPSFELDERQIAAAVARCEPQLRADTDYCQENVRAFAAAQRATAPGSGTKDSIARKYSAASRHTGSS